MRTHARTFSAVIVAAMLLLVPASASAAVSPPTIVSQFVPAGIGAGGTTSLSFTISNPNGSGTLTGVQFTDTLPTGLAVDNPNGQTGTCGPASVLTAPAGSTTISLTGGTLSAGASCVVLVTVTSATPGAYQNSTGPVTATESADLGAADTRTLTVFGPPAVTITTPTEKAVYGFGQKVIARYACVDEAGALGIALCSGDADSGTPINTSRQGPNTFSVTAVSADGLTATQTIDYVVLPDNRIRLTRVTGHRGGSVTFRAALPNPGRLVSTVTRNGRTFGQTTTTIKSKGLVSITVKPNAAARRLIKADAKAKHPKAITLTLSVSYTPLFGVRRTVAGGSVKIRP